MSIIKSRSSSGLAQILKAATVVACVGLVASPALAQGGGGGGGGRGGDRGGQPEGGGRRNFGGGGGGGMGMFGGGMGGMGRFGAMNDPLMTSRDMPKYGQILQLTDDQQEAAKGLLEAYQLEVQTKRDEMQKAQEEMRESFRRAREEGGGGDPGAGFERMREAGAKFRAEKTKLDKTFMSDLKSLLTPEQEANWATFERVHRREKQMDRGLISGERADLVKLIEEAKLPADAQAKVQPLLAQYEEELDRELVNREKVQEDLMNRMSGMQFGPDMDPEKMQRMIEEGRDAAKRVREVNRKYARQVQEQLPEDQQFAFAKAFKTASYPDVYRETYANTAIGSALGFADLGADQKQSVQAIRDNYARDVAVLNDKLAVAQEEMEENFSLQRMRDGGDRTQDGLRELRRQKRELDEATVENLRKVLTPEQQERLPQREQRGQGGGRGGEDGGQRRRGGDGQGGGRGGDRM